MNKLLNIMNTPIITIICMACFGYLAMVAHQEQDRIILEKEHGYTKERVDSYNLLIEEQSFTPKTSTDIIQDALNITDEALFASMDEWKPNEVAKPVVLWHKE